MPSDGRLIPPLAHFPISHSKVFPPRANQCQCPFIVRRDTPSIKQASSPRSLVSDGGTPSSHPCIVEEVAASSSSLSSRPSSPPRPHRPPSSPRGEPERAWQRTRGWDHQSAYGQ